MFDMKFVLPEHIREQQDPIERDRLFYEWFADVMDYVMAHPFHSDVADSHNNWLALNE